MCCISQYPLRVQVIALQRSAVFFPWVLIFRRILAFVALSWRDQGAVFAVWRMAAPIKNTWVVLSR